MRTIYLLVCFLVAVSFSQITQAQTIKYEYENGNRVLRKVIVLDTKSGTIQPDSLQAKQDLQPLDDMVGLQKTRIYPNPTKGMLRINFPELTRREGTIKLYDSNGKLIIQQGVIELNNELNLTAYPPGIYMMIIQIGQNDRKEWKIIKQ